MEVLRMHPPLFLLMRTVARDFLRREASGFYLEAHTQPLFWGAYGLR